MYGDKNYQEISGELQMLSPSIGTFVELQIITVVININVYFFKIVLWRFLKYHAFKNKNLQ